ncbi:MAG: hypothetical protein ACRD6Q_09055, partial [Nitrososphaeraceae archaeon]
MNKSVIIGLFLMASLLVGTSINMNMFTPAMAAIGQGMGQYDKYINNNYQTGYQSTYGNDPYANSYDKSYNYDNKRPSYDNGYDKSSYFMNSYGDRYNDHKDKKGSYFMDSYGDRYNDHKDKVKKYECRTGPFEGFFVSSVEFCDAKHKFNDYNKVKTFPPPGILTAEWWQWILDIPKEINPLLDETGENCAVNQQGPVWFLVGTPGDSETGGIITGSVERDCVIPEGKKILFPIINVFCSELNDEAAIREALGIPAGQPIPPSQLEEGLRICAEDIINGVNILEASIDGKEITNFENFRVQSPLFTISYPEDNPFNVTSFINIPQRAIS